MGKRGPNQLNEQDKLDRKPIPRLRSPFQLPNDEKRAWGSMEADQTLVEKHALHAHRLYEVWRDNPSSGNAANVVDAAALLNDTSLFVGPAKQILDDPRSGTLLRRVAGIVANQPGAAFLSLTFQDNVPIPDQIGRARARLSNEPRHGHLWAELGRLHVYLGNVKAARRAYDVAISLLPNDRTTLRSIARFAVYAKMKEWAINQLRRSDCLLTDPWVQAAEIALSDSLGITPKSIKLGRTKIDREDTPARAISELASSIGTLEASHGAHKKARKFLNLSLRDPTENALAQAVWFGEEHLFSFDHDSSRLPISADSEAAAYHALQQENWDMALEHLRRWQAEEPYSVHVAAEGSFYALGGLYDSEAALEFCETGLKRNPGSLLLRNNLVVALCHARRTEEANKQFAKISNQAVQWRDDITFTATAGALHLAQGNIAEGRKWYLRSIELADQENDANGRFRTRAHWLLEESSRNLLDREFVAKVLKRLDKFAARSTLPAGTRRVWKRMRDRIVKLAAADRPNVQSDTEFSNPTSLSDSVAVL